jgi:hypothetical protein
VLDPFALLLEVGNQGLRVGILLAERLMVGEVLLLGCGLPEDVEAEDDVAVVGSDH